MKWEKEQENIIRDTNNDNDNNNNDDNNNGNDNDDRDLDSSYDAMKEDPNPDDVDPVNIKISPPKYIKRPTATKPSFTKFAERIPEAYTVHNYFLHKYTKSEIVFICCVVNIKSPGKSLEYNQNRLAQELNNWWDLQAKNPFKRNKVAIYIDFW